MLAGTSLLAPALADVVPGPVALGIDLLVVLIPAAVVVGVVVLIARWRRRRRRG